MFMFASFEVGELDGLGKGIGGELEGGGRDDVEEVEVEV